MSIKSGYDSMLSRKYMLAKMLTSMLLAGFPRYESSVLGSMMVLIRETTSYLAWATLATDTWALEESDSGFVFVESYFLFDGITLETLKCHLCCLQDIVGHASQASNAESV
jgi:hypothetical protein